MEDKTEHKIIMTKELKNQWDMVNSMVANQFLSAMASRQRIERLNFIKNNIRNEFQNLNCPQNIRVPLERDIHLIEAALDTDKVVISKDKKARLNFCIISDDLEDIKGIMWADPTMIEENAIIWLKNGMPKDKNKNLNSTNKDYINNLTRIQVT